MEADALELNRVQRRGTAIELRPGIRGGVIAVDTAVIAVEELAVCVKRGCVVIDVRSHSAGACTDRGPGDPAVSRPENAIGSRGAPRVDDGRIARVHDQ